MGGYGRLREWLAEVVAPRLGERLPGSADLLVVWNNHANIAPELKGMRTPLCSATSHGNGATWQSIKTLESAANGWYCYTAMEFTADNAVLLGYCAGDNQVGGLNRLRITRIPLGWLSQN